MTKCNNKYEALMAITKYSFMLDDITLFLDTHPCSTCALKAYREYSALRDSAMKYYTENYGSLCKYNDNSEDCYEYINSPWPWEGVM